MFPRRLAPLPLALALATVATSAHADRRLAGLAEGAPADEATFLASAGSVEEQSRSVPEGAPRVDEPPMGTSQASALTPTREHGPFASLSASMGMMWLNWDDDSSSVSGAGVGIHGKLGYAVGIVSLFAEFNYLTTMSASTDGFGTLGLEDLSFDFRSMGLGLALVADVGYVSATWLLDARATATGTERAAREPYKEDASGHGARLDAVYLLKAPSGMGVGVGPYFQWVSLTTDNEENDSLTGYSYGLTLNASFY